MSKLAGKSYGKKIEFELSPAHLFGNALDTFLTADSISGTFLALIDLSIALELYLKKYLQQKTAQQPQFIFAPINNGKWQSIENKLSGSREDKRLQILQAFTVEINKSNRMLSNTINFSVAIGVFAYFYRVRKQVKDDLNRLRYYRNGLFHWKAEDERAFDLSKLALRLFEWMLIFIEKEQGHWIGGDFNIVDPMGEQRALLQVLRRSIRSENAFNIQRRIYKYRKIGNIIAQKDARLNDTISIEGASEWQGQICPACNFEPLYLFRGTLPSTDPKPKPVIIWCKRCDFRVPDYEYESIRPDAIPSLKDIYGG